jgi:pilus assembly protein CpaC
MNMKRAAIHILFIAVLGGTTVRAQVEPLAPPSGTPVDPGSTAVNLLVGRSTVVDVGTPITRVSLTSADVADALVTSPSQLLVHGKVPGAISMFIWDREGGIRRYEVAVQRDLSRLTDQMKQLLPREAVEVRSNGRYVVLSGTVSHKDAIDRAVNLASGYVDARDQVVSLLQVQAAPTDQVLLRVRFAEVSRSALTEFGMSLFTSPTGIQNTIGRTTTQQFAAPGFSDLQWTKESSDFGSPVTSAEGKFTFSDFMNFFLLSQRYDLGVMIRALQSRGLFESLAEPNLVAESGKEASFLAGGEFPIPVAQGSGANMAFTVIFKEFGIRLNFTPTVVADRVHLRVRPEVSTLDFGNAVVMQGFRIPALTTRRTETELELRDGQTFAIAGLLNNSMNSTLQKIPGIGDIPILGHLFRSKAAQKNQTELVVMITPQILRGNSVGVTSELPRLMEPFLPELPVSETLAPPPPAFQTSRP